MADQYIRDLTFVSSVNASDVLAIDQGGDALKVSMTQLSNAVSTILGITGSVTQPTTDDLDGRIAVSGGGVEAYRWRVQTECTYPTTLGEFARASVVSGPLVVPSRFGVFYLGPGTSTAGTTTYGVFTQHSASTPAGNGFSVAGGSVHLLAAIAPHFSVYDAANQGELYVAWDDGGTQAHTTPSTKVLGFRSVNGGNWHLVCMNSSVETVIDTGVQPLVGVWHEFEVILSADRTGVTGKIDGASFGPITTNIPLTEIGISVMGVRTTADTHAASLAFDYIRAWEEI